jgi:hypothetical protein
MASATANIIVSAPDSGGLAKKIFIGILAAAAIYGLYRLASFLASTYYDSKATIPTAANNARIAAEQIAKLDPLFVNKGNLPGAQVGAALPIEEKALINYNILGNRLAGYIGPLESGVFAEDDAVRIAMRTGCRVFMLPIDKLQSAESPMLIVRNHNGDKISNNEGSILKVCQAIDKYAPKGAAADPIIIILYFNTLPSANPYDQKSLKFMMDVAAGLAPLKNRHLGLTAEGDYRRQKMQDMLFLRPRSEFDGKYIILTNADTKGFREGVLPARPEGLTPALDLDLWTHGRLYAKTSTGLGITAIPSGAITSAPVLETMDYYMSLPDTKLPEVVAQSKVDWNVETGSAAQPTQEQLERLLNKLGVSCVMVDFFSVGINPTDGLQPMDKYFQKSGFRLKPVDLRYRVPKPISIPPPPPQLNAQGGFVQSPKV